MASKDVTASSPSLEDQPAFNVGRILVILLGIVILQSNSFHAREPLIPEGHC